MWSGLSELEHDLMAAADIGQWMIDKGVIADLAQQIEDRARSKLGIYQGQSGPYQAWESLKDYTQTRRQQLGFTPDEPLLRSGTMSQELTHSIEDGGMSALIGIPTGSVSGTYAGVMELGSLFHNIPPRPWLAPALYELAGHITNTFGEQIPRIFRPHIGGFK